MVVARKPIHDLVESSGSFLTQFRFEIDVFPSHEIQFVSRALHSTIILTNELKGFDRLHHRPKMIGTRGFHQVVQGNFENQIAADAKSFRLDSAHGTFVALTGHMRQ